MGKASVSGDAPADLDKTKPILCLDFDGVIHSYKSGWKGPANIPDGPVHGAIRFIIEAQDLWNVAVYSTRSTKVGGLVAMQNWLKKWILRHLEKTMVPRPDWDPAKLTEFILGGIMFPLVKPPAMVSIDDRAISFNGIFPDPVLLRGFKPWYQRESQEDQMLVTMAEHKRTWDALNAGYPRVFIYEGRSYRMDSPDTVPVDITEEVFDR